MVRSDGMIHLLLRVLRPNACGVCSSCETQFVFQWDVAMPQPEALKMLNILRKYELGGGEGRILTGSQMLWKKLVTDPLCVLA